MEIWLRRRSHYPFVVTLGDYSSISNRLGHANRPLHTPAVIFPSEDGANANYVHGPGKGMGGRSVTWWEAQRVGGYMIGLFTVRGMGGVRLFRVIIIRGVFICLRCDKLKTVTKYVCSTALLLVKCLRNV